MANPPSRPLPNLVAPRQLGMALRAALRGPLKRVLDAVLATILLVFLAPTLCLAALAVWVAGREPVLVTRRRVGQGGAEFGLLGFRTHNDRGDFTRVGAVLHMTRIDGLPRLLNVLRGEMSLVGPCPATRADLFALGTEGRACYLAMSPGLTGPWRLAGFDSNAEDADADDRQARAALDVSYSRMPSLRADLRILLRTISMVAGRGHA